MQDNGIPEAGQSPPKYTGDDTRPTSKKELAGWYFYSWAAEAFVVCGIGMGLVRECIVFFVDSGVLLADGQSHIFRLLPTDRIGTDGSRPRCSALRQENAVQDYVEAPIADATRSWRTA